MERSAITSLEVRLQTQVDFRLRLLGIGKCPLTGSDRNEFVSFLFCRGFSQYHQFRPQCARLSNTPSEAIANRRRADTNCQRYFIRLTRLSHKVTRWCSVISYGPSSGQQLWLIKSGSSRVPRAALAAPWFLPLSKPATPWSQRPAVRTNLQTWSNNTVIVFFPLPSTLPMRLQTFSSTMPLSLMSLRLREQRTRIFAPSLRRTFGVSTT